MADVNPYAWKGCLAWRFLPGSNHACFDMCSKEQRKVCEKREEPTEKENSEK